MPGEKLLEARELCAGYHGAEIIKSVSFSVFGGERVSLIGPNGCGKTTLLKALCKLLPPMSGEVVILGKSLDKTSHIELAASVAMLAQFSQQWFDFTVMDTVLMGRYCRRRTALSPTTRHDLAAAEDCLRKVGMLESRGSGITSLSGGQLQRVMLARTFAQEPRIIVLDEPTNHLDLKHQAELLEYLQEWAAAGDRAVIQVMHDLGLARRYSDRVLLMSGGRLTGDGAPGQILSGDGIDRAYDFNVREFMTSLLTLWAD